MTSESTTPETCEACGQPIPSEGEPAAAPTLDDEEGRQALLDSIEAGNSYTDAAADAGIHRATLYRWLHRGREQREGRRKGRKYRLFLDELEQAEARCRARLVNIIANAVEDDAQLALTVLERKDPANWAPRVAVMIQDDRERVLNAIFKEFEGEPEIVERFLGAVAGVDVRAEVRRVQEKSLVEGVVVDKPSGP